MTQQTPSSASPPARRFTRLIAWLALFNVLLRAATCAGAAFTFDGRMVIAEDGSPQLLEWSDHALLSNNRLGNRSLLCSESRPKHGEAPNAGCAFACNLSHS